MRKVLVLLAVACVGIAAYAGITRAAGSKQAVSTEHATLTATTSDGAEVHVDAAIDNSRRIASVSVDAGGTLATTFPASRLEGVVDGSSGRLVAYARVPQLALFLTRGKPWAKVDLGRTDVAPFVRLATAPADLVAALRDAAAAEQKLGTETVDGVQTTHLRLQLDVRRLAQLAPAAHRAAAAAALGELARATGIQQQPVDIWVDGDGRLRRATATLESARGGVRIDLRLSDFGAKVDAAAPAAEQVVDLTRLLKHR